MLVKGLSLSQCNGISLSQPQLWFHWGSNPGPSACKADVITTTLWNHVARNLALQAVAYKPSGSDDVTMSHDESFRPIHGISGQVCPNMEFVVSDSVLCILTVNSGNHNNLDSLRHIE